MEITYKFPPFRENVLPNGLTVIWLEDHEQPVLKVALQVPTGKQYDPVNREGTADLAVALAQKGTLSHDVEVFSDRIETAGAQISGSVGEQMLSLDIHVLRSQASCIVPLFWEMICEPAMNGKEFERLKKEMLTELQAEYADPSALGSKHLQAMLFGRKHPGGRVQTTHSVKQVSLEDVRWFWNNYVFPKGSVLIIAGAFDGKQRSEWEELFCSWKTNASIKDVQVDSKSLPKRSIIRLIDKPDLSQTTIFLATKTVGELHPDKTALSLGNYILGGGNFSSRLMSRVRSETGKTYGISSQLSCSREWGMLTVTTNTQNRQLKEVITVINDVLTDTFENGISEDELIKAKQFSIGHMAFEFEGVHNAAEKLLWLKFYGREVEYIERYASRLEMIEREMVNNALNEHFKRDGYAIIVVGKRGEIESQLQGFGDIHVRGFRDDPYK